MKTLQELKSELRALTPKTNKPTPAPQPDEVEEPASETEAERIERIWQEALHPSPPTEITPALPPSAPALVADPTPAPEEVPECPIDYAAARSYYARKLAEIDAELAALRHQAADGTDSDV